MSTQTNERSGPPVVVIGAGFAGLAAAVRLADAGRRVILFEATRHGGGRSRSFDHDSGMQLDNGQHLMMGCYYETLAFLRAIGRENAVEFQRNLALDMVKPGGKHIKLRCPALPRRIVVVHGGDQERRHRQTGHILSQIDAEEFDIVANGARV